MQEDQILNLMEMLEQNPCEKLEIFDSKGESLGVLQAFYALPIRQMTPIYVMGKGPHANGDVVAGVFKFRMSHGRFNPLASHTVLNYVKEKFSKPACNCDCGACDDINDE